MMYYSLWRRVLGTARHGIRLSLRFLKNRQYLFTLFGLCVFLFAALNTCAKTVKASSLPPEYEEARENLLNLTSFEPDSARKFGYYHIRAKEYEKVFPFRSVVMSVKSWPLAEKPRQQENVREILSKAYTHCVQQTSIYISILQQAHEGKMTDQTVTDLELILNVYKSLDSITAQVKPILGSRAALEDFRPAITETDYKLGEAIAAMDAQHWSTALTLMKDKSELKKGQAFVELKLIRNVGNYPDRAKYLGILAPKATMYYQKRIRELIDAGGVIRAYQAIDALDSARRYSVLLPDSARLRVNAKQNTVYHDRRDGEFYPTTRIKHLIFFTQNLRFDVKGSRLYLNDQSQKALGRLYNWETVMAGDTREGTQGICPSGTRVATARDFYTAFTALNGKVKRSMTKTGDMGLNLIGGGVYRDIFKNNYKQWGPSPAWWTSSRGAASLHGIQIESNSQATAGGVIYISDGLIGGPTFYAGFYEKDGYYCRCVMEMSSE